MARKRLRRTAIVLFGCGVVVAAVAACSGGGSSGQEEGVAITPITSLASASPPSIVSTVAPTSEATNGGPTVELRGFGYPIAGACLPKGDQLLPNAPRPYRNGIHEGVDFYQVDNCTPIARGTEVLAMRAGRVIRADLSYVELTQAEVDKYAANPNTDEALDKYRGRQVWIEHGVDGSGNKIVSRYAHLSGIALGIVSGATVAKGQVVAYVGESGTPESVLGTGRENHLHFELRVGESYLGKGLPSAQVRSLYVTLFSP